MKNSELTEEQILQRRLAVKKYRAKFAELKLRVSPEERDRIQSHAETVGESTAAFLRRAVMETIERDENK